MEASILTGLKNPKSDQQMKLWLFNKDGIKVDGLKRISSCSFII